MTFEEFFLKKIENATKKNNCYMGILKKEYPKWQGWKIIELHKAQGTLITDINDEYLDVLIKNYYRIVYIKDNF